MRHLVFGCAFLLAACGSPPEVPAAAGTLRLFHTPTLEAAETPDIVVVATPPPSPTPSTYVIQEGDTISGLAERFGLSQDDLRAANPEVDPKNMSIGAAILIPAGPSALAAAFTPTAVPVQITQAVCRDTADGGLWCFALVHNGTSAIVENVSVRITLIDRDNAAFASQVASLPLDILPPDSSLPAYLFFPDAPGPMRPQVQLLSALHPTAGNSRYLPAFLDNTLVQAGRDGRMARLSGQVHLPAASKAAARVWVAATAYDRWGGVIGVRRWEGGALEPGRSLAFEFTIAGLGAAIDSVEFAVQAN